MITNPSKSLRKHPKSPSQKVPKRPKTSRLLKTDCPKIPVRFPYKPRAWINLQSQTGAKSKVNMVEKYFICVSFLCVKSSRTHFWKVGFQAFSEKWDFWKMNGPNRAQQMNGPNRAQQGTRRPSVAPADRWYPLISVEVSIWWQYPHWDE